MTIKKKFIVICVLAVLAAGGALSVSAQTAGSAAELIAQLQKQIDELQAKITALQKAQQDLRQAAQSIQGTLKLLGQLREGMSGDEVRLLQTALSADSEVYPEGLITGYYGKLTAAAVKKFQKKHDLEQVGNVGPKTLEKLNNFLEVNKIAEEDSDGDGKKEHCTIVPPGHLIAPGWLKKQGGVRPIVPLCQNLPFGIAKKLFPATSTPPSNDIISPVISFVSVSGAASTSAVVIWTTNEPSTSKVHYGTSSPLNLLTASSISNNTLLISHSINLANLATSTVYYYVVESADSSQNVATSSQFSFATLP